MPADMPDVYHYWDCYKTTTGLIYRCRHCHVEVTTAPMMASVCPSSVLAWGNQRAEEARAATLATVRETVLDLAPAGTWSRVEARLMGSANGT